MDYRDEVYFEARPEREVAFTQQEFDARLVRIRQAMSEAGIARIRHPLERWPSLSALGAS